MDWDIVFTFIIVGTVLFFYQFGQDIFEKSKMFKRHKAKGEDRWKWATTPPYFTFKKILYWVFLISPKLWLFIHKIKGRRIIKI